MANLTHIYDTKSWFQIWATLVGQGEHTLTSTPWDGPSLLPKKVHGIHVLSGFHLNDFNDSSKELKNY